MNRPAGAPRFGGELERLFGTLKTSILWQAAGSTNNDSRGRATSRSHRSHSLAQQDLIDFYHELESSIFAQLNCHLPGEGLNSPASSREFGLSMYPMSGIPVAYDFDLMVATAIDAPGRTYRVDGSRGVNVLGRWYWTPSLSRHAARKLEVRLDSWDEHVIYARVGGAWVVCRSRGSAPSGARDFVSALCRATLRLDARTEHHAAQHEEDLALARHLNTPSSDPRTVPDRVTQPDEPLSVTLGDCADDIPAIPVKWGG
ncbi:hypothetical protein O4D10_18480 [Xanthomonas citri pv. citri]|uniref:hypothetical protein n=1 Tax=Xanthomonas citri TaxID=346 RepID=UPI0036DB1053